MSKNQILEIYILFFIKIYNDIFKKNIKLRK